MSNSQTIKADILIVTVTKVESLAVLNSFEKATSDKAKTITIDDRVYRDLGEICGSRIFMALSEMGATGLGAAQQAVQKGITALNPHAVIMVGIAFGVNEQDQSIGDILVSKQLMLYETQRVGKNDKIVPRGDKPHASPRLVNYLQSAHLDWDGDKVEFGLILSGEKLVDNINYRKSLIKLESEAIGGEMEGAGLYTACQDEKVDWILVKAICDWADGNKHQDKKTRQQQAAQNATAFVLHALQHAPLERPPSFKTGNTTPYSSDISYVSIATESKITESSSSAELEQLRSELGGIYAEKLESIIAMRGAGNIEAAWDKLAIELVSLTGSQIPQDIQARYYYRAARWAQEDDKPAELYVPYYKIAHRLNPQLDDRTYRAFELAAEKQFEDAITVLEPLDSEAVAANLLKYLLDFGRFQEVNDFMEKLATPVTDEMLRLQALCLLAAQNVNGAWQALEPTLAKNQNNILFPLTAGYIAFWQALPTELHSIGAIAPQFFISDMFSLDRDRERQMRLALDYTEQALKNLNAAPRNEARQAVIGAYLAVCVCLPDKHADAIEKAKSVLTENPIDPAPILCLMRLMADYEWSHTLDVLHKACEQPNSPIWQIEMYTDLLLQTEQNESAWQHLLRFENRFSTNDEDRKVYWLDRAVHSLEPLGRLSELADRIVELDDSDEYRRVKAGYWLRCGKVSDGLAIAKELANSPGTRLDYVNLVSLYYQERMWQELAESASICLEHFKEETPAHIPEKLARALWALNKPIDALVVLEQYLPVFERDGLINNYYFIRMNVQIAQGQYPQAWEASELLWQAQPNEGLLVQRAYLQAVGPGNVPRAIELLKQGLEQGFKTPQVLMQIAHYSLANDREGAFQYAKEAVERFPNDPQLIQAAMLIGFNSGHSDWAGMQLTALQQNFPDSGFVQKIKLSTLLQWGQEDQERSRANWQQFLTGHLPLHLLLDSRRASLGAEFYWRWHHNRSKPLREQVPFPIAYAGRSVEPSGDWKSNALSMDYSACLIAHQLKLFSSLTDSFEVIYIPPSLLGLILGEIHRLAEVQIDRVEQAEKLLNVLSELPITLLPDPQLELGDFNGLQLQDRVEWALATQEDLLIVTELFATELFESGSIPDALENLRISYADIFTALENRGELSLDDSPVKRLFTRAANLNRVEQLTDGTKLLVDSVFLEHLSQLNVLEATSRIFQLYCLESIGDQLRAEIEGYRYRQEIKKSLELLQSELSRLLSSGKFKLLALRPNQTEKHDKLNQLPLTNELTELFYSETMNCPVWIDDRTLSSYPCLSAQEPIVGVYDILLVLHSRKKITNRKFRECFQQLIRAGVGCRLPPVAYLIEELMQAKIDSKMGTLIENSHLMSLRLTVMLSLGSASILNKKPLRPDLMPEEETFRLQLHQLVDAAMVEMWTSDKIDLPRRFATANWLYHQFLPQRGRFDTLGEELHVEPIQQLAMEHSFRMSLPWQFLKKPRAINEYYRWLFADIMPTWQNHPSLREVTLSRFTELIIDHLKFFLQHKNKTEAINVFTIPLRHLPDEVLAQLLIHPGLEPYLKKHFPTGEYIESLDLFIPEHEWKELVETSISLGTGNPLIKTVKGRNITLEFKAKNGVGDMISVLGQAANGHPSQLHILIPFDRLEHSISARRIEWLDEITQAGLLAEGDSTRYRSTLASDDFNVAADALRNCCDRSGDFFFAFAQYALKISKLSEHHWQQILPAYSDILISASPTEMSAEWLFAEPGNPDKLKKRLVSVAALPFGEPFDLATLVEQALSAEWISAEKVIGLLEDLAVSSLNPVVLQNLLAAYLRLPDKVGKQKQIEAIIQTLLILEGNPETDEAFERYIDLLHLIWNYFQLTAEFKNTTYEQRVTWAYIYADRMLTGMLQQKASDSDYWVIASKNIKEAVASLQKQQNPFVSVMDDEADVILPSAASWWRTIIGGTLGILRRDIVYLSNIQETVIEMLQPLLNACHKFDHSKFQHFEFLEPTDFLNNYKNSAISNQGWTFAEHLRAQLSGEESLTQNYPMVFWSEAISKGDYNFLTSYFSILARYPDSVRPELVELLTNVIKTLIEENTFNQANKKLFSAQAALLGRLKNGQALNLRGCLMDKAVNALHTEPALWSLIPDLVFGLYHFDSPVQRIDNFITAMNRIANVLTVDTKEFSELCAFVRRIEAYIPTENWPKLWKVLEQYS